VVNYVCAISLNISYTGEAAHDGKERLHFWRLFSFHNVVLPVVCGLQDCYLIHILNEKRGSMIMMFVRTCESTRLLALTLWNLGFKAISISGQLSQVLRLTFNLFFRSFH
jgi:hypothetical protein